MNYKEIRELTEWLEKSSFTAYSLTIDGVHLSISKQQMAGQPCLESIPQSNIKTLQADIHIISSPIVGTYYESASSGNPAFVQVGQYVKKGVTLCILEAMKVMNEITADVDGVVAEIFVSNGSMVEACMPLFRIEI